MIFLLYCHFAPISDGDGKALEPLLVLSCETSLISVDKCTRKAKKSCKKGEKGEGRNRNRCLEYFGNSEAHRCWLRRIFLFKYCFVFIIFVAEPTSSSFIEKKNSLRSAFTKKSIPYLQPFPLPAPFVSPPKSIEDVHFFFFFLLYYTFFFSC